jgi:hypothetical protein
LAPVTSVARLVEHREQINPIGLMPAKGVQAVNAHIALPSGWQALELQRTALYSHQQWRSPSKCTAVGVTYIRMPLPFSSRTLAWMASNEVAKRTVEGRILRRWSDELAREWFEAETEDYHITGYAMTRGFDAWINYVGHRRKEDLRPAEMDIARKSLDSALPLSVALAAETARATASAE